MLTFKRIPLEEPEPNITDSIDTLNAQFNDDMKKYFPDSLQFSLERNMRKKKRFFRRAALTKFERQRVLSQIKNTFEKCKNTTIPLRRNSLDCKSNRTLYTNLLKSYFYYRFYKPCLFLFASPYYSNHLSTHCSHKKSKAKKKKQRINLSSCSSSIYSGTLSMNNKTKSSLMLSPKVFSPHMKVFSGVYSPKVSFHSSKSQLNILPKIDKYCQNTLKLSKTFKFELQSELEKPSKKLKRIKRKKKPLQLPKKKVPKPGKIYTLYPGANKNNKQFVSNDHKNIIIQTYDIDKINESSYNYRQIIYKKFEVKAEIEEDEDGKRSNIFSIENLKREKGFSPVVKEKGSREKQKSFFEEINKKLSILKIKKMHFDKLHKDKS